jgi:hypothetical protein
MLSLPTGTTAAGLSWVDESHPYELAKRWAAPIGAKGLYQSSRPVCFDYDAITPQPWLPKEDLDKWMSSNWGGRERPAHITLTIAPLKSGGNALPGMYTVEFAMRNMDGNRIEKLAERLAQMVPTTLVSLVRNTPDEKGLVGWLWQQGVLDKKIETPTILNGVDVRSAQVDPFFEELFTGLGNGIASNGTWLMPWLEKRLPTDMFALLNEDGPDVLQKALQHAMKGHPGDVFVGAHNLYDKCNPSPNKDATCKGLGFLDASLMGPLKKCKVWENLRWSLFEYELEDAWCRDMEDSAPLPRIDPERIDRLAALCADDVNLARLIGSSYGQLANGLHVVACMARRAAPNSVESRGVRNVLQHATFTLPTFFDDIFARKWRDEIERGAALKRASDPGEVMAKRTVLALASSGNEHAWLFLLEQGRRGSLPGMNLDFLARTVASPFVPADLDHFVGIYGAAATSTALNGLPMLNSDVRMSLQAALENERLSRILMPAASQPIPISETSASSLRRPHP